METNCRLRKLTAEQLDAIKVAHIAGESTTVLAQKYGVSPSLLTYHFRKAGLPASPKSGHTRKLTDQQREQALQAYIAGENMTQLAATLGVCFGALMYYVKKAGLPLRGKTGRPTVSLPGQTHYPCGMCKMSLPVASFGTYKAKRGSRPCAYICKACAVKRRAMSQYKISLAQYEQIHAIGTCQVCSAPKPSTRTLFIDHDHSTGQIRGLLCEPCNSALGSSKESLDILLRAKRYLQEPIQSIPEAPELPMSADKKWRLRTVFKISPAQYAGLIRLQGSACPICLGGLHKPVVDHCHTTGKVRGVICWDCNILLGKVKDSTVTIDSLIKYLQSPPRPLQSSP